MRKEFYTKLLPTQGWYCVAGLRKGEGRNQLIHRFVESLGEVEDLVDYFDTHDYDVFVTPASFNSGRRLADNALSLRSFFLDLDVGEDRPDRYATKSDALADLSKFIAAQDLPPPVIIDSGGGVHVYWLFDEDVPVEEWRPYAQQFKLFCQQHIRIDPAVTADPARLMRALDTQNHKPNVLQRTKFIANTIYSYAFSAFKSFLDSVLPPPESDPFSGVERGLDDDTASISRIDPNFESAFSELAVKSLSGEGCAQIDYILRESTRLAEPMWRAGLSIARACVDWEEAIHTMSEDYPRYNRAETIAKAEHTVGDTGPQPYTCETISGLALNKLCESCPWRGQIKSPIQLAKRLKAPPEAPVAWAEGDDEPSEEELARYGTYPDELLPYLRGPDGGVWYKPPPKKDKNGNWVPQKEIRLLPYNLYPVKRMYDAGDGEVLVLRYELANDEAREFALAISELAAIERFKTVTAKAGIVIENGLEPEVASYVKKWATYMQSIRRAEETRKQMGWTEDFKGFVVGTTEYKQDGTEVNTAASPLVRSISKALHKRGSAQLWRGAAERLNAPGYEMHAFALLCGFASPILHRTPHKGAVVGLLGESGAGKSGALYAALSAFGSPDNLALAGADKGATDNALIQYYIGMKNLLLGLDEASNYPPAAVSNLFYRVTQGKNKLRSMTSVNAVREIEVSASLITLLTTNQSMRDKLNTVKSDPTGEAARYLELMVHKPPTLSNEEGQEIFDTFRLNFGHAGPDFIKYIYKVGFEHVDDLIRAESRLFYTIVGKNTEYRYYESLVSTAGAAAHLLKEADICDMDFPHIIRVVLDQIISNTERTKTGADYTQILGEFQYRHSGATLYLNENRVIREPRATFIVARMVQDEGMYYVSTNEIRKFLAEKQVSYEQFKLFMKGNNTLQYEGKQRLTAGWPGMSSAMSPIWVLGFHAPVPEEIINGGDTGDGSDDTGTGVDISV
jgi:hypothetical protein